MSLTIAICDDDSEQRSELRHLLTVWSEKKSVALRVDEYVSAESFLFSYPDKPCHVLLLDIEMKRLNGMELAYQLREAGDALPIIFITGYSEYMSEGYEVEAKHYLLKPLNAKKLFSVLDKCFERGIGDSNEILLTGKERTIHISVEDILYIEAFGRKSQIYLRNQSPFESDENIGVFLRKGLPDFIATHRSYLVNLRYIRSIGKTEVILDNGAGVPLSRRLYKEVNEAFIRYYTKNM